jgi:hypothetical protein
MSRFRAVATLRARESRLRTRGCRGDELVVGQTSAATPVSNGKDVRQIRGAMCVARSPDRATHSKAQSDAADGVFRRYSQTLPT